MSAIKQLLCDMTTDLLDKQGVDQNDCDTWLHVHDLIIAGVIAPFDLTGELWIKDNKVCRAEDLDLSA